jgi:type III secretion system FlhB-like substrate exporter
VKERPFRWGTTAWNDASDKLGVRKRASITAEEWSILAAEVVIAGNVEAAEVIIHIASLHGVKVSLLGEL